MDGFRNNDAEKQTIPASGGARPATPRTRRRIRCLPLKPGEAPRFFHPDFLNEAMTRREAREELRLLASLSEQTNDDAATGPTCDLRLQWYELILRNPSRIRSAELAYLHRHLGNLLRHATTLAWAGNDGAIRAWHRVNASVHAIQIEIEDRVYANCRKMPHQSGMQAWDVFEADKEAGRREWLSHQLPTRPDSPSPDPEPVSAYQFSTPPQPPAIMRLGA